MEYRERVLPPSLDGWVAAVWTMRHQGAADEWIEHEATPDGCVEAIVRLSGRSIWRREQPACFATGLSRQPIRFGFSGDAAFVAVKLWPWAWEALGGALCPVFADDWIALDDQNPLAQLLTQSPEALVDGLAAALVDKAPEPVGNAILAAHGVADLGRCTGLAPRALQRWFARHVGMPPRDYLRVLRFSETMRALPRDDTKLAEVAAERGYADQAHMARDFRAMAGAAPNRARRRAKGPFL
jgi:AraC-like DNA-binding protein